MKNKIYKKIDKKIVILDIKVVTIQFLTLFIPIKIYVDY